MLNALDLIFVFVFHKVAGLATRFSLDLLKCDTFLFLLHVYC